jgi:hypothetical protein
VEFNNFSFRGNESEIEPKGEDAFAQGFMLLTSLPPASEFPLLSSLHRFVAAYFLKFFIVEVGASVVQSPKASPEKLRMESIDGTE